MLLLLFLSHISLLPRIQSSCIFKNHKEIERYPRISHTNSTQQKNFVNCSSMLSRSTIQGMLKALESFKIYSPRLSSMKGLRSEWKQRVMPESWSQGQLSSPEGQGAEMIANTLSEAKVDCVWLSPPCSPWLCCLLVFASLAPLKTRGNLWLQLAAQSLPVTDSPSSSKLSGYHVCSV